MTADANIISSMLKVVVTLQARCPKYSADTLTVFLIICQEEGFGVKELAFLSRMSESRVSRALKSLRQSGREPSAALIRVLQHSADRRCVKVFLDEAGAALLKDIGVKSQQDKRGAHFKRLPRNAYAEAAVSDKQGC